MTRRDEGVVLLLLILILGVLFGGEPDIADGIVHWLMK